MVTSGKRFISGQFSCTSTACALDKVLFEWQIKELKLTLPCSGFYSVDVKLSSAVSVQMEKLPGLEREP